MVGAERSQVSQADQRRIAELLVRIATLENEVEHWRNQVLQVEPAVNVVPLVPVRRSAARLPVTMAEGEAGAISKLNLPVFDPNRNLILDPIQAPKGEPD